jgi:hypothetical protein
MAQSFAQPELPAEVVDELRDIARLARRSLAGDPDNLGLQALADLEADEVALAEGLQRAHEAWEAEGRTEYEEEHHAVHYAV